VQDTDARLIPALSTAHHICSADAISYSRTAPDIWSQPPVTSAHWSENAAVCFQFFCFQFFYGRKCYFLHRKIKKTKIHEFYFRPKNKKMHFSVPKTKNKTKFGRSLIDKNTVQYINSCCFTVDIHFTGAHNSQHSISSHPTFECMQIISLTNCNGTHHAHQM